MLLSHATLFYSFLLRVMQHFFFISLFVRGKRPEIKYNRSPLGEKSESVACATAAAAFATLRGIHLAANLFNFLNRWK